MNPNPKRPLAAGAQRGFTIIEALVALAVVAFGLLGVVGLQALMARNADVAKQRSEATRLAQQQIESLRAYTTIPVAASQASWNGMTSGNDTATTNATFARAWTVAGSASDPMRRVSVNVAWADRTGEAQQVTLNSVISRTDPADSGLLGFPLPQNTTLKRPKNRNLNIPVPALDLGGGKSVYQLANNFAVVFSNDTGYVVMRCNFVVTNATQLSSCTTYSAFILAGYVSRHSISAFPTGLAVNTGGLSGATSTSCTMGDAVDQNSGSAIAGYKYYLCVVEIPVNSSWSGSVRLAGMATGDNRLVCRFQFPAAAGISANSRNVQPYATVRESLDNQNYVITDNATCPTISSLATIQHQVCRSTNTNRAADCPAF